MGRKRLLAVGLCVAMCATLLTGCGSKSDAKYPSSDVSVIVPKAAGGGTDTSTRGLLTYMEKQLDGAKFNVTNNADGGGITGMITTSKAKADGYTLGAVTVELDMFCFQGKSDLTYEAFDSIAMPIGAPAALIVPADAPYNTIDEFVEYCGQNSGEVSMANSGSGAIWDLATYLLEDEYGVKVKHVPYPNGTADIAAAITGKHVDATLADPSSFMSQIEAGTLKCLGIMSDERSSLLPDVPTFKESGHDLVIRAWAALVAPKGCDATVLETLRTAAKDALSSDECKQYFESQGIEPLCIIGEDADKVMEEDYNMYKELIENHDIQ